MVTIATAAIFTSYIKHCKIIIHVMINGSKTISL